LLSHVESLLHSCFPEQSKNHKSGRLLISQKRKLRQKWRLTCRYTEVVAPRIGFEHSYPKPLSPELALLTLRSTPGGGQPMKGNQGFQITSGRGSMCDSYLLLHLKLPKPPTVFRIAQCCKRATDSINKLPRKWLIS
jgi:hypothetical protein